MERRCFAAKRLLSCQPDIRAGATIPSRWWIMQRFTEISALAGRCMPTKICRVTIFFYGPLLT